MIALIFASLFVCLLLAAISHAKASAIRQRAMLSKMQRLETRARG